MKNRILNYTVVKHKKKYQVITTFIFISVVLLNLILQTMAISTKTLKNEMLNNTTLSLILMQDYDNENQPYDLNLDQIKNIENVQYASKIKPLALIAEDGSKNQEGFITYAIEAEYSYYIGIESMEDDKTYCSTNQYNNVENFKFLDIESDITLINYDFDPPMIFSDSCFMSKNTYDRLMSELPSTYTEFVVPEYIIGVNNVKNVYGVVRELDGLYTDDTTMFMYQANGLEGLIGDASNLLIILTSIFVMFIIFNTIIIFFLSSSLVSELSKDLMVLYLNGMSRKSISNELSKTCRNRFTKAIIIASVISIIVFLAIVKFIFKLAIGWDLLFTLILIDTLVIILNTQTISIFIHRMVKKKTSNENISRILRT
ncbi:MAG: hypothetical protein ACK5G7_00565 [Erysipelotrichaceae bacterium]